MVVCLQGWETILQAYSRQFNITKLTTICPGGKNGQESIFNGLCAIAKNHQEGDIVLIHDAIRPMVSADIISDNIRVCQQYGNAITCIPCAEAMLKTTDGEHSTSQIPRDNLKRTQTPQAFYLKDILAAHREAKERGITNSVASCTLYIELGRQLHLSRGSEKNIKLTTVEDIDIFKALLQAKRSSWLK